MGGWNQDARNCNSQKKEAVGVDCALCASSTREWADKHFNGTV
jgi:hypothetical protein